MGCFRYLDKLRISASDIRFLISSVLRIFDPLGGPPPPTQSLSLLAVLFLDRSWGYFRSSLALLGSLMLVLTPTWHPSCFVRAFNIMRRLPKSHFAMFVVLHRLQKYSKIIDFPMVFKGFCSLTFLPLIMLAAALLRSKSASRGPLGPPSWAKGALR